MVFDFVLTVLIVVHTPRVYPIEAKEKKPRGPEVREGGGGGGFKCVRTKLKRATIRTKI